MDMILKRPAVAVLIILACFLNPTETTLGKSKADSNTSMKTLTISGLQMPVTNDVARNEKRILEAIKKAAEAGADFLVTPEGSLSGYTPNFDRVQVAGAVERLAAAAKEHKVGLLLGTCFKELTDGNEQCYNQVRVYTPQGEYLGYHAKILRCSKLDSPGSGEMTDYAEGRLRTFEWNGISFGILICNDFWATPGYTTIPNPYLPWQLKQMGAQLIFHHINSGTRPEVSGLSGIKRKSLGQIAWHLYCRGKCRRRKGEDQCQFRSCRAEGRTRNHRAGRRRAVFHLQNPDSRLTNLNRGGIKSPRLFNCSAFYYLATCPA